MLMWLWIGIGAIAIVGVVLVVRQRQGKPLLGASNQPALPSLHRTVFSLQIGDIVQYLGKDWVVEGQLTFNDHGYTWMEYMLQDGDEVRWLSVEEDDRLEVCWVETITGLEISGTPPQQITYEGAVYKLRESGTARMTRAGTTLNKQAQQCRYYDYSSNHKQLLSVEDWDGDMEVSVAWQISPSSLTLLPGDGRRVYD
ncbi:DUF4178 domain-containing protein [Leptolyngbyaceae cyanobacterium UHCC 1019]